MMDAGAPGAGARWLLAFAFTQAVEVPLYLAWLRRRTRLAPGAAFALAAGLSAATHPAVWFLWPPLAYGRACPALGLEPLDPACYRLLLAWVEAFAVGVEAGLLALARVPRPLATALVVNAASCGLGLASRAVFGLP